MTIKLQIIQNLLGTPRDQDDPSLVLIVLMKTTKIPTPLTRITLLEVTEIVPLVVVILLENLRIHYQESRVEVSWCDVEAVIVK